MILMTIKMITTVMLLLLCVTIYSNTIAIKPSNYYETDSGSIENPYLISNLANLRWLSETKSVWGNENKKFYFKQTAEIDATETRIWNEGRGFSQIGDSDQLIFNQEGYLESSSDFLGNYDGGNYIIKNIFISNNGTDYRFIGFFGSIRDSEIKNLRLENVQYIVENSVVGALCNNALNSRIINSSVTGSIIVNDLPQKSYLVPDSPVDWGPSTLSGFVSSVHFSTIDNCFSEVNIINVVNHNNSVSGFANQLHSTTISNSYYHGAIINQKSDSAGLVRNLGNSKIKNSYAIVSTNKSLYGLIYSPLDSSVVNSYFLRNDKVKKGLPNLFELRFFKPFFKNYFLKKYSGKGLSERNMWKIRSFKGWDFSNIWRIDPNINSGFPHLILGINNSH